jgi:hypothetical protein
MARSPKEPVPIRQQERPPSGELGRVGLRGAVPYNGYLYEEHLVELRGLKGAQIFRKMADNDPVCSSIIYAIESLLRGVEWSVTPNPDGSKVKAEAAAEFVRSVLFEDMESPFGDVISEALSMLVYGFALSEIVLKRRKGPNADDRLWSLYDDGYIGIAALAPRGQETIWRWLYSEEGRLLGVEQMLPTGQTTKMPMSRLLHFKTGSRLGNPESRSILRGAYVTWVRRNTIEEAMGRVAVRSSGIVDVRVPAAMLAPDADDNLKASLAVYKSIADRLAADRQGAVIFPSDRDEHGNPLYDMQYNLPDTRRPMDMQAIIEGYNRLIAMTVLGDFLFLGATSVGSRALADPKIEMFTRAMEALLQNIAEQLNRDLLPKLWAWNGFDTAVLPRMTPGPLERRDLAQFASFATSMVGAGMQLFPDPVTENMVRQMIGLPALTEESGGGGAGKERDDTEDTTDYEEPTDTEDDGA